MPLMDVRSSMYASLLVRRCRAQSGSCSTYLFAPLRAPGSPARGGPAARRIAASARCFCQVCRALTLSYMVKPGSPAGMALPYADSRVGACQRASFLSTCAIWWSGADRGRWPSADVVGEWFADDLPRGLPVGYGRTSRIATPRSRPSTRMSVMTPQQATFADYFAKWGLTLPDEAAARSRAGHLFGAGWSVRFVWRDDATLLFRASHRMTNERVHAITPDGVLTSAEPTPPLEFMVIPKEATPQDEARVQREYQQAWESFSVAIAAADLEFDQGSLPPGMPAGPGAQLWRLDGGEWQSAPLRAGVSDARDTRAVGSDMARRPQNAVGNQLAAAANPRPSAEPRPTEPKRRHVKPTDPVSVHSTVEGGPRTLTPYFASLVEPFAAGLLHKCHALLDLNLNPHQRSRLREAISIDLRKLCDILVPAARPPRVSEAASAVAASMGVDLMTVTWHSQKKVDGYKTFTYEHMTPINWFVPKIGKATSTEEVLDIISKHMWIAWVTKEEDAELRRRGYSSRRRTQPLPIRRQASPCCRSNPTRICPRPRASRPRAKAPRHLCVWSTPSHHSMPGTRCCRGRGPWVSKASPPAPADEVAASVQREEAAEEMLAFWAPLLHLLTWGLGWVRPDIGLVEWRQRGSASDPVLELLDRWWTPEQLDDFLAWGRDEWCADRLRAGLPRRVPGSPTHTTRRSTRPVPGPGHSQASDAQQLGIPLDAYDPYRIVEHLRVGWWGSGDSAYSEFRWRSRSILRLC